MTKILRIQLTLRLLTAYMNITVSAYSAARGALGMKGAL